MSANNAPRLSTLLDQALPHDTAYEMCTIFRVGSIRFLENRIILSRFAENTSLSENVYTPFEDDISCNVLEKHFLNMLMQKKTAVAQSNRRPFLPQILVTIISRALRAMP